MQKFYPEVFKNEMISESSFDVNDIPVDTNSKGQVVHHNSSISQENCQRAKVLSSQAQIAERMLLIHSKDKSVS